MPQPLESGQLDNWSVCDQCKAGNHLGCTMTISQEECCCAE